MHTAKFRKLDFGVTEVDMRQEADGIAYLTASQPLAPYPTRLTDRLIQWAAQSPEKTLFARREKNEDGSFGEWRHISYQQAYETAQHIAQGLINRGLSVDKPVLILSENDLEHALLALGCLMVGIPFCPASPAYSTISQDFEKLRHIDHTITPGLVFAADAMRYGKAILSALSPDVEVVLTHGTLDDRSCTTFESLCATPVTPEVQARMDTVTGDTVAKFLFTSGSTKLPKAVINTQGMWCANQQQMCQSMPVLKEVPPVLIDWLPWNHTFGGNHNFGMVIYNGGTMYIDDGKPTPALIQETLRNLREIAPTVYFNVPTGFEQIANAMKADGVLRKNLLSRVHMFFYAGAALPQPVWDRLYECQEAELGERIAMTTGLGMTESGPFALFVTSPNVAAGDLGIPAPGITVKLVPDGDKIEVRYKGPNITTGYWRAPEETAASFDEEGYFRSGDAVKWIDPQNIHKGLKFDGRIAEDFKLTTGTFVSVGPLRARVIAAGAPYVQDVVVTGLNRNEVGALIFPTAAIRSLAQLDASASLADVLASPQVQAHFQQVVNQLVATATGSATRIGRAVLLSEPPSIDKGEVTDKGSINQRAVLKHRDALVEALYSGTADHIIQPQ